MFPVKEQLAQSLFDYIPVGVGSQGVIPATNKDLNEALELGLDWSLREGYAWAEDKEHWFVVFGLLVGLISTVRSMEEC